MKIFIFKDANLDEGLLFSDNKITSSKLSEINSADEVAFVLPNEMLGHRYFSNANLNIKEIKAAIINDEILNPGRSNDQLNVLGPVDKHNYYVVADEDKKLIENKLSKFGSSYNLISDAFLYVTLMGKNCQYNDSIYIEEEGTIYKFNKKMIPVLNESISNFSEKCLKDADERIFYNYEHLNFSSTFSFAANKLAYYSFALCILSLNFLGFVNLQMTNSKINEIEESKQQIFSAYFPNTEFKSAENHLLTLKNNYLNSPTNTLSNLGNIFTSISNLEYIQSFKQKGKEPSIELKLKIPNDELADVENYLLTKNIPLKLVKKTVLENYTNITYEIDAN